MIDQVMFAYIDAVLSSQRWINSDVIAKQFGCTRCAAAAYLRKYCRRWPQNIRRLSCREKIRWYLRGHEFYPSALLDECPDMMFGLALITSEFKKVLVNKLNIMGLK